MLFTFFEYIHQKDTEFGKADEALVSLEKKKKLDDFFKLALLR
jgi:hypothetical protein